MAKSQDSKSPPWTPRPQSHVISFSQLLYRMILHPRNNCCSRLILSEFEIRQFWAALSNSRAVPNVRDPIISSLLRIEHSGSLRSAQETAVASELSPTSFYVVNLRTSFFTVSTPNSEPLPMTIVRNRNEHEVTLQWDTLYSELITLPKYRLNIPSFPFLRCYCRLDQ